MNPLHLVRANVRKTYLRELKQRGIPVVRTSFVPLGGGPDPLTEIASLQGWDDVVIKPTVSAGSFSTRRFRRDEFAAGQDFLDTLTQTREAMVQGYVRGVELLPGGGERAVVFIDGELTHAVRKSPRLSNQAESVSEALPVAADERDLAEMVLRPFRERLLYARVDMVRDDSGMPMLMELELIEPSLFLAQHPPALARLAARHRPGGPQNVTAGPEPPLSDLSARTDSGPRRRPGRPVLPVSGAPRGGLRHHALPAEFVGTLPPAAPGAAAAARGRAPV